MNGSCQHKVSVSSARNRFSFVMYDNPEFFGYVLSECFPSARARICWLAMSLDTDFLSGSEGRTLADFSHELVSLYAVQYT